VPVVSLYQSLSSKLVLQAASLKKRGSVPHALPLESSEYLKVLGQSRSTIRTLTESLAV